MNEMNLELLVAAQVLDLASAIREDAWNAFATEHGHSVDLHSGALITWRKAHLISEFVPKALATLEEVAEQVRNIKASSPG